MTDPPDLSRQPEIPKRAIQEIEAALAEVNGRAARAVAHERVLSRQLQRLRADAQVWNRHMEVARVVRDEELEEESVANRGQCLTAISTLEQEVEEASGAAEALQAQLDAMKIKLSEARRACESPATRQRTADR